MSENVGMPGSATAPAQSQYLLQEAPARRWWVMIMAILAYGHFFMTIQLISAMTATVMQD
mgnify:CR=1 FL=1